MLDCQHASQLISQSMERKLSLRQRLGLRMHLWMCDACSRFSRQMQLLRDGIRQLGRKIENDPAVLLSEQARQRILNAIDHTDHPH